jgi:hypothetical protein
MPLAAVERTRDGSCRTRLLRSSTVENSSLARVTSPVRPRKLAKVPFLELADGRLQGVVSSGSDIERVYVSSIAAGSHGLSCSTNNNRPCGGLRGPSPCNHLRALLTEAVLQYGAQSVARYLRIETDVEPDDDVDLARGLHGAMEPGAPATVFNSFLRHLSYLERPGTAEPVPELDWFPALRPAEATGPAGDA